MNSYMKSNVTNQWTGYVKVGACLVTSTRPEHKFDRNLDVRDHERYSMHTTISPEIPNLSNNSKIINLSELFEPKASSKTIQSANFTEFAYTFINLITLKAFCATFTFLERNALHLLLICVYLLLRGIIQQNIVHQWTFCKRMEEN